MINMLKLSISIDFDYGGYDQKKKYLDTFSPFRAHFVGKVNADVGGQDPVGQLPVSILHRQRPPSRRQARQYNITFSIYITIAIYITPAI